MASDARAVAAWRRDRGEAVEDEDEEEAAVDEHDRQTAARERAARCVEIKWKASRAIDATRRRRLLDGVADNMFPHRRSGALRTARRARRRSAWRRCAAEPSAARGACCRRRRVGCAGFATARP